MERRVSFFGLTTAATVFDYLARFLQLGQTRLRLIGVGRVGIFSDDLAIEFRCVRPVALAAPRNGIVEIAGPERASKQSVVIESFLSEIFLVSRAALLLYAKTQIESSVDGSTETGAAMGVRSCVATTGLSTFS